VKAGSPIVAASARARATQQHRVRRAVAGDQLRIAVALQRGREPLDDLPEGIRVRLRLAVREHGDEYVARPTERHGDDALQQRLVDSRPGKDFAYLGGGERQVAGVQRQDVEGGLELASRATSSLAAVEQAVHEAGRTAERVAGGTASMRDASTQVADNVAGVSSVVEQNAAAAGEMQATTGAVTHAVASVAAAAEQQSSAAEEVSASAAELAAQTNEIALTARHVRAQAEALEALVSRFTLDDQTRAAVDGQRPCAAQSVQ
jgi:hypothetical protein